MIRLFTIGAPKRCLTSTSNNATVTPFCRHKRNSSCGCIKKKESLGETPSKRTKNAKKTPVECYAQVCAETLPNVVEPSTLHRWPPIHTQLHFTKRTRKYCGPGKCGEMVYRHSAANTILRSGVLLHETSSSRGAELL